MIYVRLPKNEIDPNKQPDGAVPKLPAQLMRAILFCVALGLAFIAGRISVSSARDATAPIPAGAAVKNPGLGKAGAAC